MKEKKPNDYTFVEQMRGLMEDNIYKYPDAVDWVRYHLEGVNVASIKTRKEKFVDVLLGHHEGFEGHPFTPGNPNKVTLIKWYRNKTGLGLRHAKEKCDKFVEDTYGIPAFSTNTIYPTGSTGLGSVI